MLSKQDAVVGRRVVWRSLDTRLSPTPGTITDVTDRGEVIILFDDGEDGSTFIDNTASTIYPA
jgi:hypothetical protein